MSNNSYYNDQWRIINEPNQNNISNYSMGFDGSSNFVNVGSSSYLNSLNKISVSSWINSDDYTGSSEQNILNDWNFNTANGHFRFDLTTSGYLRASIKVSSTTYGARIADSFTFTNGTWYYVCFVFDGTLTGNENRLKLFINGAQQTTTQFSNNIPSELQNSTSEINIGRFGSTSPRVFNGSIDQVTIFDYALPATGTNSIATLYGGGTAIVNPLSLSPKPVSYYQLGDQSVDNGANYLVPNNSLQDYVFSFDGSNDVLNCGNDSSLQITGAMTVSYWFKGQGGSGNVGGVGKLGGGGSRGFCLGMTSTGAITFFIAPTASSLTSTSYSHTPDTNWHHVVGVFTPSTSLEIYFDGQRVKNTPTSTSSQYNASNNLQIGARGDSIGFFDGEISNVSIFSSSLSSSNINTLYNNGSPAIDISSLSPVGWWKLNAKDTFDGTNWTIKDYAGSNDGSSVNMTSANLIVSDLQHTSSFSPYALDFDGINDYLDCGNITALNNQSIFCTSTWINYSGTPTATTHMFLSGGSAGSNRFFVMLASSSKIRYITGGTTKDTIIPSINSGDWHHIVTVHDGTSLDVYLDSVKQNSSPFTVPVPNTNIGQQFKIGSYFTGAFNWNGKLSNTAIWNTVLSQSEITEIYNQGVPSNLNTFSGTAPIRWWQLGSNSSYNSGAWTCLDEIGTNNAVSAGGMTNDDITNGVGYSANGLGTSSIDIVGDAPYSSGNGLSENMDVLDRVKDTPPT